MTKHLQDLPDFIADAGEEGDEPRAADLAALDAVTALIEPVAAPTALRGRLLAALNEPPLRYAPFISRIGELWSLPEERVEAALSRATDAHWQRTPLPGVRVVRVEHGGSEPDAAAYLVHFRRGLRYPEHRHTHEERVLILEGGYVDTTGRVVAPGDSHQMAAGTCHGFTVHPDGPCIAAVMERGFEFTGLLMGTLQRLIGARYLKR